MIDLNRILTILPGDCRDTLAQIPDGCISTCVTSPPYYGLRDYQTGQWSGGVPECKHVVVAMRRGLGLAASAASTRGGGKKVATTADIQARGSVREAMEWRCGVEAFKHYKRTDRAGARALPEIIREEFRACGWITLAPPCEHQIEAAGIVLDPFGGSGTTGKVAIEEGRHAILCELNPLYAAMSDRRCEVTMPLPFVAAA